MQIGLNVATSSSSFANMQTSCKNRRACRWSHKHPGLLLLVSWVEADWQAAARGSSTHPGRCQRFQVRSYLGGHPEGGSHGGVPPQAGVCQLGGDSYREEKLQVSLRLQEPLFVFASQKRWRK